MITLILVGFTVVLKDIKLLIGVYGAVDYKILGIWFVAILDIGKMFLHLSVCLFMDTLGNTTSPPQRLPPLVWLEYTTDWLFLEGHMDHS